MLTETDNDTRVHFCYFHHHHQMLTTKYEAFAEAEDKKRRRENELGITAENWKTADWNWAPTGRALPDNKRDHK